jgi:hypothetical protein
MSVSFAEAVRSLLINDAPTAAAIPGGVHPDQIPQSNSSWPAADYSNLTGEPFSSIAGPSYGVKDCSLTLRVVCVTMAQAKAAQSAIEALIESNPVRKVVGSNTLYSLRSSDASISIADISDGNDEPWRILSLTISGWLT